jgi:hypothetical protein
MKEWVQQMRSGMVSEIRSAGFDFLKDEALEKADPEKNFDEQLLFKLFVLARWKKLFPGQKSLT